MSDIEGKPIELMLVFVVLAGAAGYGAGIGVAKLLGGKVEEEVTEEEEEEDEIDEEEEEEEEEEENEEH